MEKNLCPRDRQEVLVTWVCMCVWLCQVFGLLVY